MSASLQPPPGAPPGVLAIDPYVPGKSGAPGPGKVHKLSSNETPLGPSPRPWPPAAAAAKLEVYPDGAPRRCARRSAALRARPGPHRLRRRLGRAAVPARPRLCGPGDEGIYTAHGFLVYRIAVLAAGGTPVVAPERDLTADVDAILAP